MIDIDVGQLYQRLSELESDNKLLRNQVQQGMDLVSIQSKMLVEQQKAIRVLSASLVETSD